MQTCYIAVDIGASSGRIMISYLRNQRLELRETYRFKNYTTKRNGHLTWSIDYLYQSIITGIKKTIQLGFRPVSLAIDTWAVDFVLLDGQGQRLTDAVSYRDHRTEGVMEDVFHIIDKNDLYEKTGIQFQPFNTIYQLKALFDKQPELKKRAKTFLMIPDYLTYLLTGNTVNEYTNASSTQLVDVRSKAWDTSLLEKLEFPKEMFLPISKPGTRVGPIRDTLEQHLGLSFDIILASSHDTASAVMSVPTNEKTIYLSSGTWSLMGVETTKPKLDTQALRYNFTNEGGYNDRYRLLKNIMGLWMIQETKRLYHDQYSFSDFVTLANENQQIRSIVNVNDVRFLSPENMIDEIKAYCKETDQQVPTTVGEVAWVIFNSLVNSYRKTTEEIEKIMDTTYESIHIIGGGGQNHLLNQELANQTGKTVYVGPTEATAIGNIAAQMIATGECKNLASARKLISDSFEITVFNPKGGKNNDNK